ncbi:hypothetical protein L593_01845 [Salinarchaeum sp. Harcht-Bsk1]|uniref:DUF7345 domain-containing protein n=1 Tax=Salinarchaeum sp. Harcht-Bsk1 TaxID=1333523 RepID=UPI00034249B7|nr:hypothetical protein [Salinarchaeum sp. Harcht-Bsk1]AGN00320.1 hypothetical protein L593_01845 [Salinarchaeum sp. Harcht-Bsk1]
MRTTAAALTCFLLVAALTGAAAVSGTPSTQAPGASDATADLVDTQPAQQFNGSSPETITITIQNDGDARFVLSKTFPAGTESERAAFERLAQDFQSGQYGRLGYGTFESIVDDVAAETGREMTLTDAGPATTVDGDVGRLEYRFTWTNFAQVNSDNVTVGDAFRTGEGLWLDGLGDGDRLVIEAPDGYTVAESPSGPEIVDDSLIWRGPATFGPGDLEATFEESQGGSAFPMTALLAVLGIVLAGLLAVVGWRIADRQSDETSIGDRIGTLVAASSSTSDDERDDVPDAEGGTSTGGSAASEGTAVPADVAAASAADEAPSADTANGEETVDPELLSDGERVEHLLEANGGRMKQANIVTETGWSNAKVSQLLSRLDEEDRVDKLRIGRENLITLPDVDVTDDE